MDAPKRGRLTIAGTGISEMHVTAEGLAAIRGAEKLLYAGHDSEWVKKLNPTAEDIDLYRAADKDRRISYDEMVSHIMLYVRQGLDVCVCFYGDASIACYASHVAVHRAKVEGYEAKMLPGISFLNCLFCDLGIDPADGGCQLISAFNYVRNPHRFDPSLHLVMWQMDNIRSATNKRNPEAEKVLAETLAPIYGDDHKVILYHVPKDWQDKPRIKVVAISELAKIDGLWQTVYVPPKNWLATRITHTLAPAWADIMDTAD